MSITPIYGKVATLLDELSVVLNIGSEQGVTFGMSFEIVSPQVVINDPDTKKEIGRLVFVKARVRATRVEPKYSIVESYEELIQRSLPFPSFQSDSSIKKKLPVEVRDLAGITREIKIGDVARQMLVPPKI